MRCRRRRTRLRASLWSAAAVTPLSILSPQACRSTERSGDCQSAVERRMPFCATGGRGHPLSRRTGFEAEAEFQRSNGALRYPGRRCACPGLIDRRTVGRPLVAQAGSLLYRGLGIRRPFTAPAVSPIVSCRPGGGWVAPAAGRSVSAARRNPLQQSGAARAMPEEAHSTARQPLECGGCDAAFNPQPASLPKHRTVCRLPVGGTAACHSALQVAGATH